MFAVYDSVAANRMRRELRERSRNKQAVEREARAVEELQDEIDRLTLIAHALWELLRDHVGVRDEELVAKLREIDLRTGRLDGTSPAAEVRSARCGQCGRTVSSRHVSCLYCGCELKSHPFNG